MNTSATVPATGPITIQSGLCINGASLPGSVPGVAISDWDLMFDAVRTRLTRTVGERPGEQPVAPQLPASLVQAVVLDCVRALDQLHTALAQERSQRPTS
ncbi:MAG: hypothetical protein Q8M91_09845 [Polaromonas sp.]|nr:hypothetical protein [Polaromonas sp.]MDP3607217.1 hypothetical protein [Polaromonas sp.]